MKCLPELAELLLQAIGEFKRSGRCIFDGQIVRVRFAVLRGIFTIYRGTVEEETCNEDYRAIPRAAKAL